MRRLASAAIFYLSFISPMSANADTLALCNGPFGLGVLANGACAPFPGGSATVRTDEEITTALADTSVTKLDISLGKDAAPVDLSALAGADHIVSLDIFSVNPLDLSAIEAMKGLRLLRLSSTAPTDYLRAAPAMPPNLIYLNLKSPKAPLDLAQLEGWSPLKQLHVSAPALTGTESLAGLFNLREATFEAKSPTNVSGIANASQLRRLAVSGYLGGRMVEDISFVAGLRQLEVLDLSSNDISDLAPLAELLSLRTLILSKNRKITSLAPLKGLKKLVILQLRRTAVTDLTPLKDMKELGILWLSDTPVSDISALEHTTALWGLELSDTNVSDLTPLKSLPLKHLSAQNTKVTDFSPVPSTTKLRK